VVNYEYATQEPYFLPKVGGIYLLPENSYNPNGWNMKLEYEAG
jgi:hypothetical protein